MAEEAGASVKDFGVVPDTSERLRKAVARALRSCDVVMISGENKTIGTSAHRHDLAALDEPLRSHGGLTEQAVPFSLPVLLMPMTSWLAAPTIGDPEVPPMVSQPGVA